MTMYRLSLRIPKLFSSLSFVKRGHVTQLSPEIKQAVDQENLIVNSPFPDIKIPEAHLTKYVWENALATKTVQYRTALVNGDTGRSYSYRECVSLTNNFASSMINLCGGRGTVMAMVLPNLPEFVFAFTGAILAGVIVTTISPSYTSFEIQRQIESSGATWVVTDQDRLEVVVKAVTGVEAQIKIIVANLSAQQQERYRGRPDVEVIPLSNMMDGTGKSHKFDSPDFDFHRDVVVIPYSSGTTGPPKGVELTHSNMVSNMCQISCPEMGLMKPADRDSREVTVCILPMYHVFAMNVTMTNILRSGGKMITLSKFDPMTFLNALITYKPTFLHIAPPLLSFLTNNAAVQPRHLKPLKYILVGAAPVSQSHIRAFKEKAPHVEFREGWGMSELSPAACFSIKGKHVTGSCGQVLPNTKMKVVDLDTGESKGPGHRGELCVKGPQVMKGYLNNVEATEKTIKNDWLLSGDVAQYDEDGNIFMVDRMKEMIKCKALQVSPSELEDILKTHYEVRDVAVIGVPDERTGEVPRAYIVKANRKADEEEVAASIKSFLNERVSEHKQLRGGIVFLLEIPKSPAGKILKKLLPDLKESRVVW